MTVECKDGNHLVKPAAKAGCRGNFTFNCYHVFMWRFSMVPDFTSIPHFKNLLRFESMAA